jgi:hypothetical protein
VKILKYKKYSKEELVKRLRKVTLLHSSDTDIPIHVYKDAEIELDFIPVSSILPSQFYYLEESLLKVGKIQEAFMEHNLDLFSLDGFVNYVTNESSVAYNLLPIIIEYQIEKDRSINPIILDGIHRVILAKEKNLKKIQVVKIANVSKDFPHPGYINPKGWQDVKLTKTAPSKKDKRHWRFPIEEVDKYYRDFNSAFDNVGKPRG